MRRRISELWPSCPPKSQVVGVGQHAEEHHRSLLGNSRVMLESASRTAELVTAG